MTRSPLHVIVLAAGAGTRMQSALPKVLQPLGGRPMLEVLLDAVQDLTPCTVHLVYGHGGESVRSACADHEVRWVLQAEQLGTGHAVAQALPDVPDDASCLVLYGDVPLIRGETMARLLEMLTQGDNDGPVVLTTVLDDPSGYGRIVRGSGDNLDRIVEHADAGPLELPIREVNTGIMAAPAAGLKRWLSKADQHNAQGEIYLTDVVAIARSAGNTPRALVAPDPNEVSGANDRAQLAQLERLYQRRRVDALMAAGARVADPARLDLRGRVQVGRDVFLDVDVVLEGDVKLADGVRIGPFCHLRDVELGPRTTVHSHCSLEGAVSDGDCDIGPFARVRRGTRLGSGSRVGNFVETKNASLGRGSKANHLSYLGDATIGDRVNIGAGTITCNYDGVNKHHTEIGDDAFIGSDSQLVAPVKVGRGATVGAGSTVTRDAPEGKLTISRSRQRSLAWERPKKSGE